MAESIFDDKSQKPDEGMMVATLGSRKALWDELVALPSGVLGAVSADWSFYKKSSGWILLLKAKKKTILTLIPKEDEFVVIFLFPERAVEAARQGALPAEILTTIEGAKSYSSGRPFRVSVRSESSLEAVRELVQIKIESW